LIPTERKGGNCSSCFGKGGENEPFGFGKDQVLPLEERREEKTDAHGEKEGYRQPKNNLKKKEVNEAVLRPGVKNITEQEGSAGRFLTRCVGKKGENFLPIGADSDKRHKGITNCQGGFPLGGQQR